MTTNTNTTAPAEKLWCIQLPNMGELYAAPDQQTAQKMADKHNAAMREYVEKNKLSWGQEMIAAEVIEWPHDADETHAEALLEFDPAEWGFGQPSPKVMHLPSEDTEGGSHD